MTNYNAMMHKILNKHGLRDKHDDYIDLCYIGYTKALNNYDKTKSKFITYAYRCMCNEVMGQLRKDNAHKRQRTEISFDLCYNDNSTLKDIIPDELDIERDEVAKETTLELHKAIAKLTIPEQVVIKNAYNITRCHFDKTQMSKILHVTTYEVDLIHNVALEKLKEMLKDER